MALRDDFKQALIAGDFKRCAAIWAVDRPDMPQPKSDGEAEIQMHAARTSLNEVPAKLRAWSHRWLTERDMPSLLPEEMRQSAEQMVPKVVPAVGFAYGSTDPLLRTARDLVERNVHIKIEELAADGMLDRDPVLVRREMIGEKNRTVKALFGALDSLIKEGIRE